MSEVEIDSTPQQSQDSAASAGSMLREARESQHMSIQTLASALKVPVVKLQALEEDRWDMLTDLVFTRAVALSICRVLKIDPAPVLALLPKAGAAKLSTNPEGINEPFKEKTLRSSMSSHGESYGGNVAKLLAVLLIAAAGGAALYFLPQWQQERGGDRTASAADGSDAPVSVPEPLVVAAPVQVRAADVPAVAVEPDALQVPAVAALPSSPVVALNAGAALAAVTPKTPATSAVSAGVVAAPADDKVTTSAVASGEALLRFSATGESWVQVRNAQQQVVMERILKAGDVYEATAAGRPLHVVIGNTDVTKLEIDGAAWDLAASARNNVARFEVK